MEKKELRKLMRERKRQYTPEELVAMSGTVLAKLELRREFVAAKTVMAFYSLPDEVYTHEFLEKWAGEKRFLLPVVSGEDILLKPFVPGRGMKTGLLNVQEPVGEEFFEAYEAVDLVMVPGVAFDARCNRMGRGKGFYDRFLPKVPRARKLGICFPFQMVEEVPCEPFDLPVDAVIC